MTTPPSPTQPGRRDRFALLALRILLRLPFRTRVAVAAWIGRWLAGRTRTRRRIRASVEHFLPELPAQDAHRISVEASANFGRMIIEILSADELAQLATTVPIEGPGLAALDAAHAQGRPAILASGHFGNYDVWRLALIARGYNIGGYFKELGNPALNAHYLRAVSGAPMFPDSNAGRKSLIRFLRAGGMLGILIDLDRPNGEMLDFLGQSTRTVVSTAEMALKFDAPLVPVYGIRTDNPTGFRVFVDAPVPVSDPATMVQALNDSFGAQVRAHPEQWVWWHNRRKNSHPKP